jgi:O-acetylhomoserine/O-acetylserine sulfhydrylase-like pyridoxal-dependent enzyme
MKFATKLIHAGIEPDPTTGAIMTPIYQTSTYVQEAPGKHKGYEYARTQNPTRSVLEANLAALENGNYGICFASGLAAQDAVMKLLNPGDLILSTNDLYGGSFRQMRRVYEKFGIKSQFVNLSDPNVAREHIRSGVKLLWVESKPPQTPCSISSIWNWYATRPNNMGSWSAWITPLLLLIYKTPSITALISSFIRRPNTSADIRTSYTAP